MALPVHGCTWLEGSGNTRLTFALLHVFELESNKRIWDRHQFSKPKAQSRNHVSGLLITINLRSLYTDVCSIQSLLGIWKIQSVSTWKIADTSDSVKEETTPRVIYSLKYLKWKNMAKSTVFLTCQRSDYVADLSQGQFVIKIEYKYALGKISHVDQTWGYYKHSRYRSFSISNISKPKIFYN